MQPLSGNQRPDLLTSLMNMSLVLRLPWKMHLCWSSSNVPRLPMLLKLLQKPHVLLTFDKVHNPLRRPRETTSERPKVVWTCGVFNILTWTCALRHNGVHFFDNSTSKSAPNLVCFAHFDLEMCFVPHGVHFFDISTSKSAPNLVCFAHFDLEMCVVPQRRALFRHLNFQKCSEHEVFCTFWLRNVLRARTACNFSSSWLRTRRFSEPTFRPSGATNHWKNTMFCDFATLSRTCIFCLLALSLLWFSFFFSSLFWLFPPLFFHLSILSEIWLLNFLRWFIQFFAS